MAWYNPATWTPVDAIQDKLNQFTKAANSFQGSSGNKVVFSNPTGAKKVASTPAQQTTYKPAQSQQRPTETAPKVLGASTTGGSGNAPETDPVTGAYYSGMADRLRSFLGGVDRTKEQGLARIGDEYNQNATRLNEGYGRTKRDLAIKGEEAEADRSKTLRKISGNVANTADSFRRLLGMGHAGNSAFARDFVPVATARMGSQQRGEAMDSYGRNARQLEVVERDAEKQYGDSLSDLGRQRRESEYNFSTGVENTRQDLLDRLSEALYRAELAKGGSAESVRAAIDPFNRQATSSMDRLAALFDQYRNPTYSVAPVNAQVPELETYTADPLTAQFAQSEDGAPADSVYLPSLRKRFQELVA